MLKKKPLIFVILLLLVLTGCGKQGAPAPVPVPTPDENAGAAETKAFEELWAEAPDGTIAILINFPSEKQLSDFPATETLVLENTEERLLLIPSEDLESFTISEMEFVNDEFIPKETVYENLDPEKNFVLDLTAMRPEGGPHFLISLKGPTISTDYYLTYNGKDGTANIEYVLDM